AREDRQLQGAEVRRDRGPVPADRLRQGAEVQAEGLRGGQVLPEGTGLSRSGRRRARRYGEASIERARASAKTSSGMLRKVATTSGSKWVPAASRIRSRAASSEIAFE